MSDSIDHPAHYGSADDPYEAIKVIEAWGFGPGFCLGSALKYIKRAGHKPGADELDDLMKARWYLDRAVELASGEAVPELDGERVDDEPKRGTAAAAPRT